MVVGNVQPELKDGKPTSRYLVDVENVLYGFTREKRLQVVSEYRRTAGRHVLALGAIVLDGNDDDPRLSIAYALPADEVWSQRALARARLDTNVLSAAQVLVGRA
ncbi:MAG TPA: hypothetical protein VMF30_12775, partial [Pirellulales bacterium]|nr:hypothetical protein [Pirellulales bacterium]